MSLAQRQIGPAGWLGLGTLALIWGASFVATRATVGHVGVLTVVAARVAGGALLLWGVVLWRGLPVPPLGRMVRIFAPMGLLASALPFALITWGQQHIEAGLAAILNAATAVFAVIVAATLFADERLTANRLFGVLLGFAGLVVVIGPSVLAALDVTSLSQLAVLGAALSYAVAGSYARARASGIPSQVVAAGMLTAASAYAVPLALWVDGWPHGGFGEGATAALLYLSLVATGVAYLILYRLIATIGAGNTGLVTLLVAPVSVVLGAVVFGEALGATDYLGFAILALGLLVLDGRLGTFGTPLP